MAPQIDTSRLPAMVTWDEVKNITNRLERLDAKLDAVLGLSSDVNSIEERVRSIELWIAGANQRTSSWQWVRDAILALALAVVGAGVWMH